MNILKRLYLPHSTELNFSDYLYMINKTLMDWNCMLGYDLPIDTTVQFDVESQACKLGSYMSTAKSIEWFIVDQAFL